MSTPIRIRRAFVPLMVAAVTALWTSHALAQQQSSADALRELMQHRQEMSSRAVEETQRRRFEDGKSDTAFPSDARNSTRGGVLRALTPEQREALRHNERGLEFFSKGKLDNAIKEYEAAIRADPQLSAAHNNLGSALFAGGHFEEAAAEFRSACELDPDYGQAFFNLALTYIKLKREKDATEALDGAMRAYKTTGEADFKAGRYKEAEAAFRGMLQIDPEYAPALVRIALVYNSTGRYEEAIKALMPVTQREPNNAATHEILAEALLGAKDYQAAAVAAERAVKLSPGSANACYLAGLAYAFVGRPDAALEYLDRLHRLHAEDLAQKLADAINQKASGE